MVKLIIDGARPLPFVSINYQNWFDFCRMTVISFILGNAVTNKPTHTIKCFKFTKVNIYKPSTYSKPWKKHMNRALLKGERLHKPFFKNCSQKKCLLSFQNTQLLYCLYKLYCLQIYFLSVLNKIRYFESFSKNLKYSIYPFYAAFLFLLKNLVRYEADVHMFSRGLNQCWIIVLMDF